MRRKDDARDDMEGVAQRLRSERPEIGPLELDRIKASAMSHTRSPRGGRLGTRRLAVLGLTVGLLAATTGGVIAGQDPGQKGGNAATAQYGNNCDVYNGSNGNQNGNGNGNGNGNENGNGNNNQNCNQNSFNETVNNVTNNYAATTINNYTTVAGTPAGGVLDSKAGKKPSRSSRRIRIHVRLPHGAKLRKVIVSVNGKRVKTLLGKKASANIELVKLPCSSGATTVEISITLSSGKTVTARHSYHLCVA